ncbi:MAG: hypothetical protein R8K21_05840 [Mariprofundales bacterium]
MSVCALGRIGFTLAVLLAVAITRDLAFLLLLLLASVYLLRRLTGNWQQWRVVRWVLPWLLLPIIVLHIVFDPRFIASSTYDWQQSLPYISYLVLHLISLYAAGMLVSHSLSINEWLALLACWPRMQRYAILLPLLPLMRNDMQRRSSLLWFAWHKQKKWQQRMRALPDLLLNLVMATIIQEQTRAAYLWLRWDGRLTVLRWHMNRTAWLAILLGYVLISIAWQYG